MDISSSLTTSLTKVRIKWASMISVIKNSPASRCLSLLKWKDPSSNTIDFLLRPVSIVHDKHRDVTIATATLNAMIEVNKYVPFYESYTTGRRRIAQIKVLFMYITGHLLSMLWFYTLIDLFKTTDTSIGRMLIDNTKYDEVMQTPRCNMIPWQ